jgi:hypothetical protein
VTMRDTGENQGLRSGSDWASLSGGDWLPETFEGVNADIARAGRKGGTHCAMRCYHGVL